jgi:hypothetical protein
LAPERDGPEHDAIMPERQQAVERVKQPYRLDLWCEDWPRATAQGRSYRAIQGVKCRNRYDSAKITRVIGTGPNSKPERFTMTHIILALAAVLAFLASGATAPSRAPHHGAIIAPADAIPPGPGM